MNREDARKAAQVMLAYADGKEIEWYDKLRKEWCDCHCPKFNWGMNTDIAYRIKPTPTYRPFANAEECWEEMKKHEPFGWVKAMDKEEGGVYVFITLVGNEIDYNVESRGNGGYCFENAMKHFTFADGTPFGKLTEEE